MRAALYVIAVALALGTCHRSASNQISADDAKQLLIDRNWIDRMPTTETDRLHVYRFVPTMGGGVFQDRTIYKGQFELFTFSVDGDKIHFKLPQTHDDVTSRFRIEKVAGPEPFDLKLTIDDDPRGPDPHVYYGVRAETDRDGRALEQRLLK